MCTMVPCVEASLWTLSYLCVPWDADGEWLQLFRVKIFAAGVCSAELIIICHFTVILVTLVKFLVTAEYFK